MITVQDKIKCSGCQACVQICPKRCISMHSDEEGFLYPTVDTSLCIECGLCEKSCPILHHKESKKTEKDIIAYAAVNKDERIRMESSSGGVFSLLASYVIQQGGVVFGAKFDENFNVEHQYTETIEGIAAFRGSKYVQSKIGDAYTRAESFLKAGRLVLFTGTPCQIGGLLTYLGKDYSNLLTQDIICHGVSSPMVWRKYIQYREDKALSKTQSVFFRNKENGWKTYSVLFVFLNHTKYIKMHRKDSYMKAFLKNLSLRPSCYNCSFKSKVRSSDITLADFWGIQRIMPELDDNKGCSLVFVNSEKGMEAIKAIQDDIQILQVNAEAAMQYNTSMTVSPSKPSRRKHFFYMVNFNDWSAIERTFLREPLLKKLLVVGKAVLSKIYIR